MKTVTVTGYGQTSQVKLNGYEEEDLLTPAMARTATRVAFGAGGFATVTDDQVMYRVTNSVRRLETRDYTLRVRLTESEQATLQRMADDAGISLSEYVRSRLF